MRLTTVTMTGADKWTSPDDLVTMTKEFPFVEWGILVSKSQSGNTPRYPPITWLEQLTSCFREAGFDGQENNWQPLSVHIQGRYLRDLLVGDANIFKEPWFPPYFRRIQLNFHADTYTVEMPKLVEALSHWGMGEVPYIFQADGVNNALIEEARAAGINVRALFDKSGGSGITPEEWPAPVPGIACGYAGGIGPDNIEIELDRISKIAGEAPIWIDMETKIRDDHDRFDLIKVRECLTKAREWIKKK